ncbi:cupin domain-containing protein [Nocardioides sp. SYSU DS0651]|uniref:cupin domain-containing protein n=1 Tax=Nocardioides sp. SYSU DS0651 TaxID=3415955 RepID=UPI003F4C0696
MTSAFLLGPGEGPEVSALGSTYVTKTDGSQVGDAYSLTEETFWADTTPLHVHAGAEEAFYVLAGEVEAWVDGARSAAGPGTFLVVPRGRPHRLRRLSAEPVRMLTLISPPGFEKVFDAVAEAGEDELLADPERLVELAARFGTEVLGDYPD